MNTMVISDLDGTLLNSGERLSEFTVNALNSLMSRGVNFTYATARSLNSARKETKGLKVSLPVITYNGACIKSPETGEIIEIQGLDGRQVDLIRETLDRFGISPLIYTYLDGEEKVLWQRGTESAGLQSYLDSREGDGRMLPVDSFDDLFCGEIFYVTCIEDTDELLSPIRADLTSEDSLSCMLQKDIYPPSHYWLEIMDYRVSKAHALDTIKKLTGMERIISFGDSINDVPLFEVSDECYAVANAVEPLKRVADDVIGCNDEDSVAKWLIENFNRLV